VCTGCTEKSRAASRAGVEELSREERVEW